MASILLRNARVVTPTDITSGKLLVEGGVISQVRFGRSIDAPADRIIDADRRYPSPGFVDIHTHDAGGADLINRTLDAIYQARRKYMEYDTTSIVSTIIISTKESLLPFVDLFNQAQLDRENIPNILGLHLEGPHFAYEQRGAQDPEYLHSSDPEEYNEVLHHTDHIIRWSFVVELGGADLSLCTLREHGIISSLAHSDTIRPQVLRVYKNGISALIHFYSTMSGMYRTNAYRVASVIEAGYPLDDLFVEVITNGEYLLIELLQLIYKIKGSERICLVTDSMRAAGMPDGGYILDNREAGMETIVEDGVAKLLDRPTFVGSVATTDCLARITLQMTMASLREAVKMMTPAPVRLLRIDDRKGSISKGKDVDLLLFGENVNVEMILAHEHVFKEN